MGHTRPIMFQNTNNVTQRRTQRGGETIVVCEKYCTTVTATNEAIFDSKCINSVWRRDPQGQITALPQSPWLYLGGPFRGWQKQAKEDREGTKGGEKGSPPPQIPRSATAVTLANALHTRACNQHSTFTSKKLNSPQNSPTKSRDLCYGIYILTAMLLGVLQVCSSLVDCSVLETPPR